MDPYERRELLLADIGVLRRGVIDNSEPKSSDVRSIASPILRKWFCENTLYLLQKERQIELIFKIPQLKPQQKVCESGGAILFSGAHAHFRRMTFLGAHVGYGRFPPKYEPAPETSFYSTLKVVKNQQVLYWMGSWAKREEVLRYSANKAGGVHFDSARDKDVEQFLDKVRNLGGVGLEDEVPIALHVDPTHAGYAHSRRYDDTFFDLVALELVSASRILCSIEEQLQ